MYNLAVQDDPALAMMMSPPLGLVLAAMWGMIWGSFFNVAAYRLASAALEDESETWLGSARHALRSLGRLLHPPSACPSCGHAIRWYDNVPILGWLALRGRCRDCQAPISAMYPAVEALSGLLAAAVYQRWAVELPGATPIAQIAHFLVYFYFAGALLVLSLIDAETTLLPLAITLPAIPFYFLCGRALHDISTVDALLGFLLGFGSLFLLRNGYRLVTGREGLGGGDEMLVGMVGALLGWRALPVTLFFGATLGTLVSVPSILLARRREPAQEGEPALRHVEVPFGPFLATAAMVYLLFGKDLQRALESWVIG